VVDAAPDTTIAELQRRLVEEKAVHASTGTIWTFLAGTAARRGGYDPEKPPHAVSASAALTIHSRVVLLYQASMGGSAALTHSCRPR